MTYFKAVLMSLFSFYRIDFPVDNLPDNFTYENTSNHISIQIFSGDKYYKSLSTFLASEKNGWRYDYTSYAPQSVFRSKTMEINCTMGGIIVNYLDDSGWIQISKETGSQCPAPIKVD